MTELAAAAAAATIVSGLIATVVTAIVVVDEQQDHDDEQQPRAVRLAAKEITQTHIRLASFLSKHRRETCFHFHTMPIRGRCEKIFKNGDFKRKREKNDDNPVKFKKDKAILTFFDFDFL